MAGPYRAHVRLGPDSDPIAIWDVEQGDPPTLGPMLPLTIGWQMPNDGRAITAPEPTTAQLSLIGADVDDFEAIDIGTLVHIQLEWDYTVKSPFAPGSFLPMVSFDGRVADRVGRPRLIPGNPPTQGFQLDLSCVDLTADLGESDVAGVFPYQTVSAQVWVETLFQMAGRGGDIDWWTGGAGAVQIVLNDGRVDSQPLSEAVEKILASYADGGDVTYPTGQYVDELNPLNHALWATQRWRRGWVRPVHLFVPDFDGKYEVQWVSRRNVAASGADASTLPMELAPTGPGGTWRPELIEDRGAGIGWDLTQVISADYVDFDAEWTRTKATSPTTITVANNVPEDLQTLDSWRQVSLSTTEDRAPVVQRVPDCNAVFSFNARQGAEMLLPDLAPYKDTVKSFRWYADRDPAWPLGVSWFHDTFPTASLEGKLPILITDIPESQSPASDRGWYAGQLRAAKFTLAPGGRYYLDFQLAPGAPPNGGTDGFLAVQDTVPLGDVSGVDPSVTVHDIRLVRKLVDP